MLIVAYMQTSGNFCKCHFVLGIWNSRVKKPCQKTELWIMTS